MCTLWRRENLTLPEIRPKLFRRTTHSLEPSRYTNLATLDLTSKGLKSDTTKIHVGQNVPQAGNVIHKQTRQTLLLWHNIKFNSESSRLNNTKKRYIIPETYCTSLLCSVALAFLTHSCTIITLNHYTTKWYLLL